MTGHAERTWLLLIGLTCTGAWLAESGEAGWPLSLVVAVLITVKGRLVIDRYMDIGADHPRLRAVLHGFVTLVPLLVVLSQAGGDLLRRLTTLH